MSSAEVETVLQLAARLNRGDLEGYLAGFSADSLRHVSGLPEPLTKDEVREQLAALMFALDGLVLEDRLVFGSDGHVFAHWVLRGTHVAPFLGLPGTGKDVEVEQVEVYTFTGSTISASHVYGDPLDLLRQLEPA